MFHIDKTILNPNISVTIRFTSILHEWLHKKADKEQISFNQMVLLCCKYVMDEEKANAEGKGSGD
ncbi:hypothetical protein VSQ48_05020 [Candidatus Ventrimonas sp. KK005]|jgi:hypothetical protein|nr:hypothetical protein [Clostridiaceae bacterium]